MYNWSPINTPALFSLDPEPCQFSFIVTISDHRLEGVLASSVSIKTQVFNLFILDVWTKIAEEGADMKKTCFIMENASLYVSNTSTEFANKYKIRWITIPPYSPQLNAAEKAITVIKAKLRQLWIGSKSFNLKTIKNIVDSIQTETWKELFCSFRKEVLNKMKNLNISN